MRERQEDRPARPLGFAHDAARDDVARREIAVGVIARHERLAARVDQPRAFAAQRLGDQEPRRAGTVERRRVKLHELEIGDARAGVDTRARCRRRWRPPGFVVSRNTWPAPPVASSVARGAHLVARARRRRRSATPHASPSSTMQLGDERVIDGLDRRQRADALPERAADLAAGRVAGMQDAPHAVRRLAAERRPPVARRDRTARPSRSARGRSAGRPRRARGPPPRRTGRRRRGSCPRRAAPGCRRRRSPRRCRPARSRCCSRRVPPW